MYTRLDATDTSAGTHGNAGADAIDPGQGPADTKCWVYDFDTRLPKPCPFQSASRVMGICSYFYVLFLHDFVTSWLPYFHTSRSRYIGRPSTISTSPSSSSSSPESEGSEKTDRPSSRLTSVTATVINVFVNERIGFVHVHLTAICKYTCL